MGILSNAALQLAHRYPSTMRSLTELVGRGLLIVVPKQSRKPHWLLTKLAHQTGARIPVRVNLERFDLVAPLNDWVHQSALNSGSYEPETTAIFNHYLKPGMTVIDAGAHVGIYSLYAARAVGPTGTVHAFEADPRTARWLRQNVRRNGFGNVYVNCVALGDHEGDAVFHIGSDAGVSSLEVPRTDMYQSYPIRVPMMTLADYVTRHRIARIDFLKMDIEGVELAALTPLRECLASPHAPVMVVEFAPQRQRAFGKTVYDLAAFLRGCGYALSRIGRKSEPLPDVVPEAIYNVLCTKGGH